MNRLFKWVANLFKRPRLIIVIDWFADQPLYHPALTIRPLRGPTEECEAFKSILINGELMVDIDTRRIYQKLDGKIVEWKYE